MHIHQQLSTTSDRPIKKLPRIIRTLSEQMQILALLNVIRFNSEQIWNVIRTNSDTQIMSLAECSEYYQIWIRAHSDCYQNTFRYFDNEPGWLFRILSDPIQNKFRWLSQQIQILKPWARLNVQNIIRMFSEDYQNTFRCSNDKFALNVQKILILYSDKV